MDVTEGRRYRMHIKDVVLRGVLCVMDNGVWEVDGVQFRKEDVWLSEELLTEDFANNGDGTFSDTGENQLWSDNPSHFGVAPWNERPLPLGFRLPTLRELRTLFASTGFRRRFPEARDVAYWTSTVAENDMVWRVTLDGGEHLTPKTVSGGIWPVKDCEHSPYEGEIQ